MAITAHMQSRHSKSSTGKNISGPSGESKNACLTINFIFMFTLTLMYMIRKYTDHQAKLIHSTEEKGIRGVFSPESCFFNNKFHYI